METMHLSVKDYCKRYNLSKPTVYKLINDNKIKSFLDGKRRLIEVKQDDKIVNKEVSKTGNLFNHIEVNKTEDKQEIEQLKLALKDKENEVKNLYERLIQAEKEQKEEIKELKEELKEEKKEKKKLYKEIQKLNKLLSKQKDLSVNILKQFIGEMKTLTYNKENNINIVDEQEIKKVKKKKSKN